MFLIYILKLLSFSDILWLFVGGAIALFFGFVCKTIMSIWNVASTKHKKEWLHLYWFYYESYGKTGIKLPRALLPLFQRFERKKFGLIFEASRVIIINNSNADQTYILFCKFEKNRQKNGIKYDLGAAGMIPIDSDPTKTAADELFQELRVKNVPIQRWETVTPAQGYNCIIHMFVAELPLDTNFKSDDGTYISFKWIPVSDWSKYQKAMRPDVVLSMLKLTNKQ